MLRRKNLRPASVIFTTGEDEVRGAQQYVRERLQQAEVHQVGEEADSHHQHWEAFKDVQTRQDSCRELDTFTQDTGVVVATFHCRILFKFEGRDIHSPLSCTLLFDWWLLCILLLVLPSSTGQRLVGRQREGEEQEKRVPERETFKNMPDFILLWIE